MSALAQQEFFPNSDATLKEKIESRRSEEIVIGFISPIGCGLSHVISSFKEHLDSRGYEEIINIKLSEILKQYQTVKNINFKGSESYARYRNLQEAGKNLRQDSGNLAILAEYAASAITMQRSLLSQRNNNFQKIAFLIDQIKRPEEVELLRAIYRNNFYLVGTTRSKNERSNTLRSENMTEMEAGELMSIDRNESDKYGQKVDKALHLSDFFINNIPNNKNENSNQINRFIGLIHGEKQITPKPDEMGMYAAYMAGLKSACLSRQVGAAISTSTGEIISTGCNDVPKFGGGLYYEGSEPDARCMVTESAECHNDKHKTQIKNLIKNILIKDLTIEEEISNKIVEKIHNDTRLGSLIEFSRAVHAEMDAIIAMARVGGTSIKNSTLYTTTFPCHNCARHIVAAGITRVVYIEPYEKSLAIDLHSDSISFDQLPNEVSHKVNFTHFSGVAPHRFHFLFYSTDRKDKNGKFIKIKNAEEIKKIPEYLDSYRDFEKKAVENFNSIYNNIIDTSK